MGVILEQADTQLLIVGIVAGLGGARGQRLDEGGPIVAGLEVGGRPVDRLEGAQSHEGVVEPLEELVGRHGLRAARGLDLDGAVVRRVHLVMRGAVHEGRGHEEELEPVRVLEAVEEPPHVVAVLVAVLGHGVAVGIPRLEDELGGAELDGVDDLAQSLARSQERHDQIDVAGLLAAQERFEESQGFHGAERPVVAEEVLILAPQDVLHDETGHLVRRVPARAHRHVRDAGVEHASRVLPAHHARELDGGARPVRLVAGRVGAVVEHPVLHVDEPGEDEVGKKLRASSLVTHDLVPQAEEDAVRVDDLAALDEGQPGIQLLREGALDGERLLVAPVDVGEGRLALELQLVEPHVVPRHLAEELVPGIEPGGDIPDRLGQRQIGQLGPEELHQVRARPRAEEAVVIVHETNHAVVEALMVRHVRVGSVDANDLTHQLGQGPAGPDQVVEDLARPPLVALEDLLLQSSIGIGHFRLGGRAGGDGHLDSLPSRARCQSVSVPRMCHAGLIVSNAVPGRLG